MYIYFDGGEMFMPASKARAVELAESAWFFLTDRGQSTTLQDTCVETGYDKAVAALRELVELRRSDDHGADAWRAMRTLPPDAVRVLLMVSLGELDELGWTEPGPKAGS